MPGPELGEQFEDLAKQAHAARLGMWVFLGSELVLFGGMFGLYAGYRAMYGAEFAAAVGRTNQGLGAANTLILITSSCFVAQAVTAVRAAKPRLAGGLLLLAIGGGAAFLALKLVEYAQHFREGFSPGIGYTNHGLPGYGARMFFAVYYLMTAFHGLHVLAGIVLLTWLMVACFRRRYSGTYPVRMEVGALYWSLVDVVWIFLWPLLYLLHSQGPHR